MLGDGVTITECRVRSAEAARAAARGAAAWNTDLVIAVGGDGTVNACVNGIGDAPTRLAVVPAGTANDLARVLGQRPGAAAAAVDLQRGERRDIDAIDVDGVRFYSAGGLGWVADVADLANRLRAGSRLRRWAVGAIGSLLYTVACVAVILFGRSLGARYRIRYRDAASGDERTREVDAYGMLVANCDRVGKAFFLAPVSRVDDGRYELIVFPRTTRLRLLRQVLAAQRGRMFDFPDMEWIQVTCAHIDCDRPQRFFGDGEILAVGGAFATRVAPTAVRLMAPPAPEPVVAPIAAPLAEVA